MYDALDRSGESKPMINKLDNLIFYVALVSWLILPFLIIFGVTYNTVFYTAILAVFGPLRIGYHYLTN